MNKKLLLALAVCVVLVVAFFAYSQSKKPANLTQIPTSWFMPLLEENAEALENEDIEKYMQAIHPDSPSYEVSRTTAEALFAKYDMEVSLDSVQVVSATEDEFTVRVVQTTTEKNNAADFRGNKTTGLNVFRKDGDDWKIYSTSIDKVEYLD